MSQKNETAAMLVSQTSPVEVELFTYDANAFFCSNKFAQMLAMWMNVIDSWRYGRTCADSGGGEPQACNLNIKISTWHRRKSQEEAQKSQKVARIGKLKNLKTDYFQINFKNSEPTFFQ